MTDPDGKVELGDVLAAFVALRRQNTRVLQALAEEHGITRTDLRAVTRLRDVGEVTPKGLGEFLDLTQGSVTALVDRVERAGLARREPHPHDRRSLLLRLTDEGRRVAENANAVYENAFRSAIDADDLTEVHGTFLRVAEELGRHGGLSGVEDDEARSA